MTKPMVRILVFIMLFVACTAAMAQVPPPPPGPDPNAGDIYIGGTPIADGMLILVALALGYAARVYYNNRKRRISE
jgi:hypothetical protein